MNSLSAGEIESSSREAFLLGNESFEPCSLWRFAGGPAPREAGHAGKTNFYLCGRARGVMFRG
jgi:hypothetical protein